MVKLKSVSKPNGYTVIILVFFNSDYRFISTIDLWIQLFFEGKQLGQFFGTHKFN